MKKPFINVVNASQNNLKNLSLELPLGEFIVITGVSGSGKSSLAFDTIYAEGQRRYVETFSPYARQFLDRMDKPKVERIDGIPPAIAIDQANPVRTSRSTVGTMTELNDHLKLLFARASRLFCYQCGCEVVKDTPDSILKSLQRSKDKTDLFAITFEITVPDNFTQKEIQGYLEQQGYTKILRTDGNKLEVVQDRLRLSSSNEARFIEAIEAALKVGNGRVTIYSLDENKEPYDARRYSAALHCAHCDIDYQQTTSNSFSFNSPMGACEVCRGFGRTMGVDYNLVIPDELKTLAEGAVKPWQTQSNQECQDDLMKFAKKRGVPVDVSWNKLSAKHKAWVIDGEGDWDNNVWYGIQRFFDWLESKSYKMHIRVLLSKYRAYNECAACDGSRLKPQALLWRLGSKQNADAVLNAGKRFKAGIVVVDDDQFQNLPGLCQYDVMLLPLASCLKFFNELTLPKPLDEATDLLLGEIKSRLHYLVDVGLGYLTLDRQSRTLSGGEVQRINLTTALGTSLVNTLFVLDEPSVGLHPRDMDRVVAIMHRLRDAGNSLLVVEHDPQVMLAADKILDIGPGPGEHGGEIEFFGSPVQLLKQKRSLTAKYLNGALQVSASKARNTAVANDHPFIQVLGATHHNLKNIDVSIPLNRLVCITGVSGSGKSTLTQDVLYNALSKMKGKPKDIVGEHRAIIGHEQLFDVVMVDQSAIGKTTRSNPASFVGALDGIRKLFADEPLAKERSYTAGTFSFNSGNGRCPTCSGNGFEHVEMQFLSDVYIRCVDCDGKRFRDEILEVKLTLPVEQKQFQSKSVADVLDMTVSEAVLFFAEHRDVLKGLVPLQLVGLDYLKLGQPVPTLSGGEAQRLKLAGHLAKSKPGKSGEPMLFLFDEPTTGLHFDDISKLLKAFEQLLEQGHSVVVIEHNLDVVKNADWIIDLGPEGGDQGGELLFSGSPKDLLSCKNSHTAKSLKAYEKALRELNLGALLKTDDTGKAKKELAKFSNAIQIRNAREHNLKNVSLDIPREKFTVITGVSGSGKSTIAFDILFNEGQRRYLESLNAYARQFVQPASRPDVDAIFGIPPTVAIEQRTSRGGVKSTVATTTEIYHFLRLLFVKLGTQYCPTCDVEIQSQSEDVIVSNVMSKFRNKQIHVLSPLVVARKGYYTDLAKWAAKKSYTTLRVDGEFIATDNWPRLDRFKEHDIELPVGAINVTPKNEAEVRSLIAKGLDYGKGMIRVGLVEGRSHKTELYSTQRVCPCCHKSFSELDPRMFSFNSRHGWCESCSGTGLVMELPEDELGLADAEMERDQTYKPCPACDGQRLRPEALSVRMQNRSISSFTKMSIAEAETVFSNMKLKGKELEIARDVLSEISPRLRFLKEVGLDYLTLDRAAPTLSGGEAQRIRLASQLGSNLRGVCYIMDEPTIGLHPRDNKMLLDTLAGLEGKGNTIVVVEHDEETIRRAEHIIDIGPGAGSRGGRVVAQGTVRDLMKNKESVTGRCLAHPLQHPLMERRVSKRTDIALELKKVTQNNIKNLSVRIPLQRLVCVSGVSGSGKSTLIRKVLVENIRALLAKGPRTKPTFQDCDTITGYEHINRLLEVDQTPIGKTPRSCPATYIGFWDDIRKMFAQTAEARLRGYSASRFSFNVKGGRCEECEGQGMKRIEMSFLPDVKVGCEVCNGMRFNPETLSVVYKGKSIGDVLNMSVDDAIEFFKPYEKIYRALQLLHDVGLGYLTLGQQSPTLSGGEAQRIKLVSELAKVSTLNFDTPTRKVSAQGHTLYVLDEPTIGLHMADVEKLIRVLHRLVDAGNTVIIVEHYVDVIAEAEWILVMGPEGGNGGVKVGEKGTPEQVVLLKDKSHTAAQLAGFLK